MNGNEIDMRMFAQRAGASVSYPAGSVVFNQGDAGICMYVVQSGVIEMTIGDKVIEVCGPNEAASALVPAASRRRASFRSSISVSSDSWSTRCRISRSTSWARWRGASAAWARRCDGRGPRPGSGSLGEGGVAYRPFVPFAACRTEGAQILLADAQERADLGLDAGVDFSARRRASEKEMLHGRLHREDFMRYRRSLP